MNPHKNMQKSRRETIFLLLFCVFCAMIDAKNRRREQKRHVEPFRGWLLLRAVSRKQGVIWRILPEMRKAPCWPEHWRQGAFAVLY
jgi:hypothetical protein